MPACISAAQLTLRLNVLQHLGSLRNETADCYPAGGDLEKPQCLPGYTSWSNGHEAKCCQGTNGHLLLNHPLHFGFDEFVATPGCAPSATTNCGCFWVPPAAPTNDSECVVGHYNSSCATCHQHLECGAYFHGIATPGPDGQISSLTPWPNVSSADDESFLVDRFENLLERAVVANKPFLAVLFFHGVHIPYVATAESRAQYAAMGMSENEQDYWGTITQLDTAVGRVRALLKKHQRNHNTLVTVNADNGPEVSPASGQGTGGSFINPGRTGGLRGRKRDLTEGGIREIGLVEAPWLFSANREEKHYPFATMDLFATVLDLLGGMASFEGRPLDGVSLVPFLSGKVTARPMEAGLGWYGSFRFGSTDHINGTFPFFCPNTSWARELGDHPADQTFDTPGHQPQLAWAEGNHMKLFGCVGRDNRLWQFFLYNLTTDRAETTDLWAVQRPLAKAMLGRFLAWQRSVVTSQGPTEIGCADPMPPRKFTPVPQMQSVQARCSSENGNKLGQAPGDSAEICAEHTAGMHGGAFSWSSGDYCWIFKSCDKPYDRGNFVYNWSSFTLDRPDWMQHSLRFIQ